MIKSYTITTTEIDDGEQAARDIAEQLASVPLLKNSVGLVLAHPEFLESGIYGQITKGIPFPLAGMTTISHCSNGKADTYMLSVMILTSDDCQFSCGLSESFPLGSDVSDIARAAYADVRGRLEGAPRFAVLYAPFYHIPYLGNCLTALSEASGNLPVFGAAANDDLNTSFTKAAARTLFGAEMYDDRFALVLASGAVEPKFYMVSVSEDSMVMPRVGVITKAKECWIEEINNVGAADFLRGVGFLVDDPNNNNSGLLSSIFILHIDSKNDGVRVSRIPHGLEGNSILCGGEIIEGAVLSIAFNTREGVLETAKECIGKIAANHNSGTVIIHSCLGRRFGLLSEPQAEMELLCKSLSDDFNCMASYANGELCPTTINSGKADNRFHNQTLIACIL